MLCRDISHSPTAHMNSLIHCLLPTVPARLLASPHPYVSKLGLKSRCRWPSSSHHPTLHREGYPSFCPPSSVRTAASWSLSVNSGNTSALHPLRPAADRHHLTSWRNASSGWSHLQLVLKFPGHHLPKRHLQLPHLPLVKLRYLQGGRARCPSPPGKTIHPVLDVLP